MNSPSSRTPFAVRSGVSAMSWRLLATILSLGILAGTGGLLVSDHAERAGAAEPPKDPAVEAYRKDVAPILSKYCFSCHGGAKPKGGLALDRLKDDPATGKEREVWEKVSENLRSGEMPPKEKAQPSNADREKVLGWIDSQISFLDRNAKKDPGRVTIRRLNRAEYNNTIRDLLGIDFHAADDFPADDVGYGFDNIGDVLSLPPLLMERYLAAADKIAAKAIATPEQLKGLHEKLEAAKMETAPQKFPSQKGFRNLYSNGEVFTHLSIPRDGEYSFRIRAYGDQAGKEPAKMAIRIDNRTLKEIDVPAESEDPQIYRCKVKLEAGTRRVAAAFTNDFIDKKAGNPRRRDRNLHVEWIEIEGPVGGEATKLPPSHDRIMIARPKNKSEEEACARQILEDFATKAYRRPVNKYEVNRFVKLVIFAQQQGDSFERGIQLAVQAILTSPHFIYRVEIDSKPNDPDAVHHVNDHELASRLSYFLWSSMPDDELFAEAKKGTLRTNLAKQAQRMVKDPKARALVENFGGQWLQTRNLKTAAPDTGRFPGFNEHLRGDMLRETELFFEAIIKEDRCVLDFIDADFTFLNERLAKHYGIDGVKGEEFRRVKVSNGQRGGILTQASILTATSNPTRTSPVKRGKWILENILGTPPPPPPPDAGELVEGKQAELSGSLRQRMEQHRAKAICASCHQRMDPLGFGFENYDAVGAWRTKDGNFGIDPSGELPGGQKFQGPAGLKQILKARKEAFAKCLAEKMLTYALGRGLERYDRPAIEKIATELGHSDYRFSRLVTSIVESDPFQKRRGQAAQK
jgi:mono/diheme cytochrome c family protein